MSRNRNLGATMRIVHRYLGFFLAGIMAIYALSGIVLIFRDTNFLKQENQIATSVKPNANEEELGKLLDIRRLKIDREEGDILFFKDGSYNKKTGEAKYKTYELPTALEKLTHLHKAKTGDPLFFLNVFFGLSLLFFVVSAFWMFLPKTSVFKKGLYFTAAGIVLTIIMLLV